MCLYVTRSVDVVIGQGGFIAPTVSMTRARLFVSRHSIRFTTLYQIKTYTQQYIYICVCVCVCVLFICLYHTTSKYYYIFWSKFDCHPYYYHYIVDAHHNSRSRPCRQYLNPINAMVALWIRPLIEFIYITFLIIIFLRRGERIRFMNIWFNDVVSVSRIYNRFPAVHSSSFRSHDKSITTTFV
jgi:hypothetical protein